MATSSAAERPAPRRGPRKIRLDTRMIVDASLQVAAESGSSTFSAKALGAKLGVDPSAVYRHFPSKTHLMEVLLDELQVRAVQRVEAGPDEWRERLLQLAEATLAEYCRHPSIAAESMVLTTHGPGELAAVEMILDALSVAGLGAQDIVKHYALLSSYILSMGSGIARSRAEHDMLETVRTENSGPWLDGPILADPRVYPQIARCLLYTSDAADD